MKYDLSEVSVDMHFSSTVYRINRDDLLSVVKPVYNEYIKKADTQSRDDVYPVLMTGDLSQDSRVSVFTDYVARISWDILNSQGYFMDPYFTQVTAIWGQNHPRLSNMEYHVHGDAVLSGFYFIDTPLDSSSMIIYDPRSAKNITSLPIRSSSTLSLAHNQVFYTPEPGDLIFTNSWLPHSFTRNRSKEDYNFLHINVNVTSNPNYQPSSSEAPIIV